MTQDLEQRVHELELRQQRLEDDIMAGRRQIARDRRRERWTRIAFWIVVGGAYVYYLRYVSSIG